MIEDEFSALVVKSRLKELNELDERTTRFFNQESVDSIYIAKVDTIPSDKKVVLCFLMTRKLNDTDFIELQIFCGAVYSLYVSLMRDSISATNKIDRALQRINLVITNSLFDFFMLKAITAK